MQYKNCRSTVQSIFVICAMTLLVLATVTQAQTFTVLYEFTGAADGRQPFRGHLLVDKHGNLLGNTAAGGNKKCTFGCGVAFAISPTGAEKVLHTFTGPDGAEPYVSLIMDATGNTYGVAEYGGSGPCSDMHPSGCGIVFKKETRGKGVVLHSFNDTPDGSIPNPGLVVDAAGNLYGTTELGGTSGNGTIFKIDATGKETVLYSFSGSDGQFPISGLVRDKAGNLYGTAVQGGASDNGSIFKLDLAGKLTILHNFSGGPADGAGPFAALTPDFLGNLYGTTDSGGTLGNGTVFKINGRTGTESVVYNFIGGSADGADPYAELVIDAAGNLYGTTLSGGTSNDGTIFKVDPTTGQETVLHNFTGVDGRLIYGALVFDSAGNLYGTALEGGAFNSGTVFKLTP